MEVFNIRISFKSNKFKKRNNVLVSETFIAVTKLTEKKNQKIF